MIDSIIQISTGLCCLFILFRTEPALNRMTGGTQMIVRLSFYQIAVSAGAELLAIVAFGYIPGWREGMLSGGLAALLLCERRIHYLANFKREGSRQYQARR